MTKQNQIISIEKGVKSKALSDITALYKAVQKEDLFNGFSKNYQPVDENGQTFPPESKRVQYVAKEVLREVERITSDLFTIEARKDWTNTVAKADVKLPDGTVLIKDAPATFLLFLEKELININTFVSKLPVLDNADDWKLDENSGLYKTDVVKTHKTAKEERPIVLYDATEKHPAQTQLITKDVVVGYWNTIKQSGAVPKTEKDKLLSRVDTLIRAVKEAREAANSVDELKSPDVSQAIFEFLFR